jgi:hypothetical protein
MDDGTTDSWTIRNNKFLVTIKSHLFWPLFSSSFVKNPRQRNGCLRFLPRLIKK